MMRHLRVTGFVAPLAGGALMAGMLMGVSACAELPFSVSGLMERATAQLDPAPVVRQFTAAPEERTPPPFQADEPQPAPPMPRAKPALLLTVAPGDTVSDIAHHYGVESLAIIALNDLSHPYWLRAGQRLVLPRKAAGTPRRNGTPQEAPRYAQSEAAIAVTEIAVEPLAPPRMEPEDVARVEPEAPAREGRAPPARAEDQAPEPPARAEDQAPEPPATPVQRVAYAESEPTPPTPTVYALARQSNAEHVPLPPTRNTFLWPLEGRVISGFGSKPGGKHNDGINIAAPVGSEIRASRNGVVAYAGNELRGYGNLVLIRHDGGWMTAYAHNDSLLVGKGDVVRRGQVISRSGKSGGVSRPQSHFEIRRDGEPQDPAAPAHPQVEGFRSLSLTAAGLRPAPARARR